MNAFKRYSPRAKKAYVVAAIFLLLGTGRNSPLLLSCIGFGGFIVWIAMLFADDRQAKRRRLAALAKVRCARCGYDLRATPDRCPECGAVIEHNVA